jgi:hypothetical protein
MKDTMGHLRTKRKKPRDVLSEIQCFKSTLSTWGTYSETEEVIV